MIFLKIKYHINIYKMSQLGVPVLPNIPQKPTLPVGHSLVQLKHYDSKENQTRINKSKVINITNKVEIELLANKSAFVCIDYKHTYEQLPFIYYTIICSDDEFSLSHHLSEITNSTFTLKVHNKSINNRKLSIYYNIKQL